MVIKGPGDDPYKTILQASEKSIALVVVNGTPRFGDAPLMRKFGSSGTEAKTISKKPKLFNLKQVTADPVVGGLTLSQATERMKDGLNNIKKLATRSLPLRGMLDKQGNRFLVPLKATPPANAEPEWVLVLDHNEDEGEAVRPHFDPMVKHGGLPFKKIAPMEITPDVLVPIQLDALTVAGDRNFFKRVGAQMNLPDFIKTGLKKMYGDL